MTKDTGGSVFKSNVTFTNAEGKLVAALDFNGDELKLTGKADEAATIFIDYIAKFFKERLANIETLSQENARLREALEFYADRNEWLAKFDSASVHFPVLKDMGDKARQALQHGGDHDEG